MKILSIDTSSDVCSVAILDNNTLIKELNKTDSKTHSENLMPLIDTLFKETFLSLSDIDAIACSIGPGSFTGIRIGIASAKAMAEVMQIPLIGVTSLETLSYLLEGKSETIASLIDARNNQVYCCIFNGKSMIQEEDYLACDINEAISHLKKYPSLSLVGNGCIVHRNLLESLLSNLLFSEDNVQSAYALGRCAFRKWQNGEISSPDSILPLYLRPSQAERMKQNNGI